MTCPPDDTCEAVREGLPVNALQACRSHPWIHPRNLHADLYISRTCMLMFARFHVGINSKTGLAGADLHYDGVTRRGHCGFAPAAVNLYHWPLP